jgi:pimeloyl-ACP methyl ester carboxylesterase
MRRLVDKLAAALPEPAAPDMRAEDGTPEALRTHQAEMVRSLDDLKRLRDDPLTLPDVPITLISGTKASKMGTRRQAMFAAHKSLAAAAPQGVHVNADESGHMVPFSEPQPIVDEVLRIVDIVDPR